MLTDATILVVDDDADTLELLQALFESAGAAVRAASSADTALRACLEQVPDVLVSEIAMPGQDGYELMRQVKGALGSRAPRVTIALTAFAGPRHRDLSAAEGFDRHVPKPFDPESLVCLVRDLLACV